jgi:FixJ family two-component response regulator
VRDSIKVLLEGHGLDVEDFGSTSEFASQYRKPVQGCLILDTTCREPPASTS